MPGPVGSFIDDFVSLTNKLLIQHRMLIVGDFNFDQMLPEHVDKVDPLIQILTYLSVLNIQLIYMGEYWIWYLILQIPILVLLCCHPTVITLFFFSKSDVLYLYRM